MSLFIPVLAHPLTSDVMVWWPFLITRMQSDGYYNFNENQVDTVRDLTTYAYYTMYALLLVFSFVLLPMAYFFFDEKDEEAGTSCCTRLMSSMKFTLGFLVFMASVLLIGAFAVAKRAPDGCTWALNESENSAKCGGKFAEEAITQVRLRLCACVM